MEDLDSICALLMSFMCLLKYECITLPISENNSHIYGVSFCLLSLRSCVFKDSLLISFVQILHGPLVVTDYSREHGRLAWLS